MANVPIVLIDDLSKSFFDNIVQLKSDYKISLADSFVLATAIVNNATVITSDHHEMDAVEKSGLVKFPLESDKQSIKPTKIKHELHFSHPCPPNFGQSRQPYR